MSLFGCINFDTTIDIEPSGSQFSPGSSDLTQHCYGGVLHHRHSMKIVDQVFSDYEGIPKFFIEHHTDNHVAKETGMVLEDRDLASHLSTLPLNNTIVIMMGDHGKPNGKTKRGRYEHMNPLMLIAWPTRVLDRFPSSREVLAKNEFRLLTVMDLYRTLRNMVRPFLRDEISAKIDWKSRFGWFHPGINILEHEIPLDRKCKDAMIPPPYCPCVQWKRYSKTDLKPEYQRSLVDVFYRTLVSKGMQMEESDTWSGSGESHDDLRSTFVEHCYVDRTEYGDHAVAFEEADFDIETFESIVSLKSLKVGAKIAFRASFVGNVALSPEEIVPIFAVVGEGCLDGTCPISMPSIVRTSLYKHEPCIPELSGANGNGNGNDAIPYCICKLGTEFTREKKEMSMSQSSILTYSSV
jgi:hypothetical protein